MSSDHHEPRAGPRLARRRALGPCGVAVGVRCVTSRTQTRLAPKKASIGVSRSIAACERARYRKRVCLCVMGRRGVARGCGAGTGHASGTRNRHGAAGHARSGRVHANQASGPSTHGS
eukprot:2478794-Prymnesium_polylepis.1